ncbi:type 1 glutamine amidotransferase [Methanobacterium congolense]|uniref:Lipid II isoglutaminyl synthase (glutamine-hydrolyzing) subunit GatD n=1 Tax=Methanobacterium congolense TaxID=118062 RepID=A0A1D3L323_9EURY|nr:glutamine amidotransferase [Methanobacterium congolense]SCG85955.1 putative cobyric acid synthase [Methanobacterium congolense]
MELNIYHMYPEVLNLYGDIGNVVCLKKRCEWSGITPKITNFDINSEKKDLKDGDIFFIGGGSDRSQNIVYSHFRKYTEQFKEIIEDNGVVLAICGGYQLLGEKYIDSAGNEVPGLGIFNYSTLSEEGRLIGNIIIENQLNLLPKTIVGFENHGGRTYSDYKPLGIVKTGYGNNGKDMKEGIVYKNCIGTYLHGPLLPKNPHLADYLILKALERKYGTKSLNEVTEVNEFEYLAHDKVIEMYSK